jgi:hypothetical protein
MSTTGLFTLIHNDGKCDKLLLRDKKLDGRIHFSATFCKYPSVTLHKYKINSGNLSLGQKYIKSSL